MNWNQIKDNWKQVTDEIMVTWGKLSEDDLATIAGDREQFASLLRQRYGYQVVQAEKKVDDFARRLSPKDEAHSPVGSIHQ